MSNKSYKRAFKGISNSVIRFRLIVLSSLLAPVHIPLHQSLEMAQDRSASQPRGYVVFLSGSPKSSLGNYVGRLTSPYRDLTLKHTQRENSKGSMFGPSSSGHGSEARASYKQHQSGPGSSTLSTRLTAYTHTDNPVTGDPVPERYPAAGAPLRRSSMERNMLLGVGAQFSTTTNVRDTSVINGDLMENRPCRVQETPRTLQSPFASRGLRPMDRYLAEGPSEQSSVISRPDTGDLSTQRCRCNKAVSANNHATRPRGG